MTDLDIVDASRRDFLRNCTQAIAGVSIIGVVAPLAAGCASSSSAQRGTPTQYDVSSLTADRQGLLTTTNGPDGLPLLIVRRSASDYTVLSSRCPHKGCGVEAPKGETIRCPCHGSTFDLSGAVTHGPAVGPLMSYPSSYDAMSHTVTVTFP